MVLIKTLGQRSLRNRLLLSHLTIVLMGLTVLGLLSARAGSRALTREVQQANQRVAVLLAQEIRVLYDDIMTDIAMLAKALGELDGQPAAQAAVMARLTRIDSPTYHRLYLLDARGSLVLSRGAGPSQALEEPPSLPAPASVAAAYRATRGRGIHVSPVKIRREDLVPVFYVTVAVRRDTPPGRGQTLVVEVDLRNFWTRVDRVVMGRTGRAFLVSREGLIIAHPDRAYIGRQLDPVLMPVLEGYEGHKLYTDPFSRRHMLAAYSPVDPRSGWAVVVEQDAAEIQAESRPILSAMLLVLVLTLGGSAVVVLFIAQSIVRPVRRLQEVTRKVAQTGDLAPPIPVEGPLEIAHLARSFDQMLTRLREVSSELRQSQEAYRMTFENISDIVYTLDPELRILSITPSVERVLGYLPAELLWRSFSEVGMLAPEFVPQASADARRILAGERIDRAVYAFIARDGTRKWVEVSGAPLRHAGRVVAMASVARDITERRQAERALQESEARFRELYESVPVGLFRARPDGLILEANRAYIELLGCPDKKTLFARQSADIWLDSEQWRQWMKTLESHQGPFTTEVQWRRLDGRKIWVRVTARAVMEPDRSMLYVEGLAQDISRQRQLEEEIRHTQKLEAIGTLAGGIAHDFNNILAAIFGYTELAFMELPADAPARAHLTELMKAARRAKDLVAQILAFSRKSEEDKKPILLTPILKEALKLLRSSLPTTIEIRQNIEPEQGVALADPTRIHQLLINLCTNAAHAMRDTGGVLEVGLANVQLDETFAATYPGLECGPYFKLTVRDTGTGIAPDILNRIFEPYFTTKQKDIGTGLGLSIVHGIVKDLKGEITVESEVGKGSTFTVYLPRIERSAQAAAEEDGPLPIGNESVLVVDDEESIVRIMQRMLERLGYRVTTTQSAAEALEYFRADPNAYDLLITDLTMPGMTGDRLAQAVLSIKPGLPILLCTGFSERIDQAKARDMGIQGFLMKPLAMKELAQSVRALLDRTEQ